jgi:4-amino-4-deoxy-L-arabinose transferase-like glycosyltransferase
MAGWGMADGQLTATESEVLAYVRANRGGARVLLATMSAGTAAPYIIATGEDVVALGGFNATDQAVTVDRLRAMVGRGELRYIQTGGFAGQGAENDPRLAWITANCGSSPISGLYSCG